MKPAPFDYVRAGTLAEAHDALAAEGGDDAPIIAGGQTPGAAAVDADGAAEVLVDIMQSARARRASRSKATRSASAQPCGRRSCWPGRNWPQRQPLLAAALPWVGHAQTRSRGTVCGSVAHADPSAEIPLALLALGGERRTVVAGEDGAALRRTISSPA